MTTPRLTQLLPAPVRYQHLLEGVEVLNALARAEHDRFQRIVGQVDRNPCFFAQPLIEAAQQRTAAGQGDTAVHDVAGKLGRALVERGLDDVHYGADGFGDRVPDLPGRNDDGLRQAADQVTAADLGVRLVRGRAGRSDRHLDLLGGPFAQHERVLLLDEDDDRPVHFVAADADGLGGYDAAERDHRYLGGP